MSYVDGWGFESLGGYPRNDARSRRSGVSTGNIGPRRDRARVCVELRSSP